MGCVVEWVDSVGLVVLLPQIKSAEDVGCRDVIVISKACLVSASGNVNSYRMWLLVEP
jgi:hypothetical protein